MTKDQALEKLELEIGASQQEIKQQYQEFYNEFQLRITNAPTTHQKSLYQKKLKELEEAYDLLTGQKTDTLDSDIPWASPGKSEPESPQEKQPEPTKENISKTKALSLLALKEPFTEAELETAFETKKSDCEKGIKEASLDGIKDAYKKALFDTISSYQLLIPIAKENGSKEKQPIHAPKNEAKEALKKEMTPSNKKRKPLVYIIPFTILTIAIVILWRPWEDNLEDWELKTYLDIKQRADEAIMEKSLEEALKEYSEAESFMLSLDNKNANEILINDGITDSISSINKKLEKIKEAQIEENEQWQIAESKNTIAGYKAFLKKYPEGTFQSEAEKNLRKLEFNKTSSKIKKIIPSNNNTKKRSNSITSIKSNLFSIASNNFEEDEISNITSDCGAYFNNSNHTLINKNQCYARFWMTNLSSFENPYELKFDFEFPKGPSVPKNKFPLQIFLGNSPNGYTWIGVYQSGTIMLSYKQINQEYVDLIKLSGKVSSSGTNRLKFVQFPDGNYYFEINSHKIWSEDLKKEHQKIPRIGLSNRIAYYTDVKIKKLELNVLN